MRLWNVADPGPRPAAPLTGPSGYVYSVSFSPGGHARRRLTDGTVWLWKVTDPARPALVASLTGPAHAVLGGVRPWRRHPGRGQRGRHRPAVGHHGPAVARRPSARTSGQPLTSQEWATYIPGLTYRAPC